MQLAQAHIAIYNQTEPRTASIATFSLHKLILRYARTIPKHNLITSAKVKGSRLATLPTCPIEGRFYYHDRGSASSSFHSLCMKGKRRDNEYTKEHWPKLQLSRASLGSLGPPQAPARLRGGCRRSYSCVFQPRVTSNARIVELNLIHASS
jgi:hypothetical protein